MDLESGKIFAQRYRVERLLARGGMGSVYVAQQLATEALVALKVLDPRMLESESQCRAFEVEAKVAARVRSHHIVRTLDAGYDELSGCPFLVMELLEGEVLHDLVERDGPLPAATVARYVSQIAAGLDRAHAYTVDGKPKAIIHRDLKPSNLMLTEREDGTPEIKILDFGIAKVLGQTTGVSREIKGTPSFMAFEQAAGENVSPQTDIWALGLIAFYLLTGKSYWRSASSPEGTLESLLGEVLALPLLPATERMRALGIEPAWPTEAFDAWFARCVHREPSERFESAGLAAHALQRALLEPSAPTSPAAWAASAAHGPTLLSEPPGQVTGRPAGTPAAWSAPPVVATRPHWPWLVGLSVLLLLALGAAAVGLKRQTADVVNGAAGSGATARPEAAPGAQEPTANVAEVAPAPGGQPATGAAGEGGKLDPRPTTAQPTPEARSSARPTPRTQTAPRAPDTRAAPRVQPESPKLPSTPSSPVPEAAPDDLYNRR